MVRPARTLTYVYTRPSHIFPTKGLSHQPPTLVLPMGATEKISVTVPTNLLWEVKTVQKSTGKSRSEVISDCVQRVLGADELPAWGQDHEDRISRIEEAANL